MSDKQARSIHDLRTVVVGTGFIGPVHVEALRRIGVNVVGLIGSTPQKSKVAARRLGVAGDLTTLDEALADPDVDCIHLATPNHLHYPQVKQVLAAGKHVMCEKPLAMNTVQSSELVRLADASDLKAGVAYNIRFYPLCHEAAARIAAGDAGPIHHITGSYVQDWLLHRSDFNWRVTSEQGGELRAVADIGTHWLDMVQFITKQKVIEVMADLQTVHSTRDRPLGSVQTFTNETSRDFDSSFESVNIDTEDAGSVLLRFDGGARGVVHVSQTTAGRKNSISFEIAGSRQTLAFHSEQPNTLWAGFRDQPNQMLIRDPSLMSGDASAIANYPGGHAEGFPDTFKQLFKCFYQHIASGSQKPERSYPTFEDGHREIMICEAILKSHRQQTWVSIDHE
ncbi:MAG: Gfo/Idh/MocA family oxidoreductase [Planctomycetota bacterium]